LPQAFSTGVLRAFGKDRFDRLEIKINPTPHHHWLKSSSLACASARLGLNLTTQSIRGKTKASKISLSLKHEQQVQRPKNQCHGIGFLLRTILINFAAPGKGRSLSF